jgi:hypothetical protein
MTRNLARQKQLIQIQGRESLENGTQTNREHFLLWTKIDLTYASICLGLLIHAV